MGHATIRRALKAHGIGVATGEHAHNRMVFKQLLQAEAIDVCQIDSCRLAGVSEVLSVLFMATKWVMVAHHRFGRVTDICPWYCIIGLGFLSAHMQAVWGFVNM